MTHPSITYRDVQPEVADDVARLIDALRGLSVDLDDEFTATEATLTAALEGPTPAAQAILALSGETTCGAALFSPVFSTVLGAAGVYVSDLWVDPTTRGQGLGRGLLAAIAMRAETLWQAKWVTLAVYDHSEASRRFYERLGFQPRNGAQTMLLHRDATRQLIKDAQ